MCKSIIQLAEGDHHSTMESQKNKQNVQETETSNTLIWIRSEGETSVPLTEGAEIHPVDV